MQTAPSFSSGMGSAWCSAETNPWEFGGKKQPPKLVLHLPSWMCSSGLCLWHLHVQSNVHVQRVMALLMTSNLLQHVTLPWLALISERFDFLAQSNTVKLEVGQIQLNLGEMGKEDPATCSCLVLFFTLLTVCKMENQFCSPVKWRFQGLNMLFKKNVSWFERKHFKNTLHNSFSV